MDTNTTLVIVDMQPYYPAARCPVLIGVIQDEIRAAIEQDYSIIALELAVNHNTDERLAAKMANYPRASFTRKSSSDGSVEVSQTCERCTYPIQRFLVCGVNLCACVAATTEGLAKVFPESKIELLRYASRCTCPDPCHLFQNDRLQEYPNVRIIENKGAI